jgi:Calcium binding
MMRSTRTARASRSPRISKARLAAMVEEATVDCYNEPEQVSGWFTMIEENLAVPFEAVVLRATPTGKNRDSSIAARLFCVA